MHDLVRQTITDGVFCVVSKYLESIGFHYAGGCGFDGEQTVRGDRGGERIRVRFRVEPLPSRKPSEPVETE